MCPECLSCCFSPWLIFHRLFHSLNFYHCVAIRCRRCLLRSAQVRCYARKAAHCDLRDPGWGDPGFLQDALLLLSHLVAILFLLFAFVFLFRSDGRCDAWHIRCCREHFLRANSYSFMACFFRLFFGCCFLVFVFGFCFCVFALFVVFGSACWLLSLMRPGNSHRSAIALFCDPSVLTDMYGNLSISFRQVQTC